MIIGSILKLTAALNYNQDHLKEQASRIKTEIEKRKMIQQIEKFVEETYSCRLDDTGNRYIQRFPEE